MLTPRQIAEQGTFFVAEVGSSAHGTNLSGVDDLDLMGVCFQPSNYLLGLRRFEQYIFRTAEERAKHNSVSSQSPPSQPGNIDLAIYSVQKYLKLALAGNPSILILLFSPQRHYKYEIDLGGDPYYNWSNSFLSLRDKIASVQAGPKFLGYLRAQKERMLGRRGQMRVNRKKIIDEYGFDTKYAAHACRLGLQGIEYMQTGRLTLPMVKSQADTLKALREGAMLFSEVIDWIDQLDRELVNAIDQSSLPLQPNIVAVDDWLVNSQLEFFEWQSQNTSSEFRAKLP